jgi:hypothetical protein
VPDHITPKKVKRRAIAILSILQLILKILPMRFNVPKYHIIIVIKLVTDITMQSNRQKIIKEAQDDIYL